MRNKKTKVLSSSIKSETYQKLTKKYGSDIINSFLDNLNENFEDNLKNFIAKNYSLPISIFKKDLTNLESIVKYLKENFDLHFSQIAPILNRDERNIWHAYNSSRKKHSQKLESKDSEFNIPISIFSNRKLSIQENLVLYLKDNFKVSYHEVAQLIHRDDRTVWTVYQKAKRKNESK